MSYPPLPRDFEDIPLLCLWVPSSGWIPVQGATINTDANGYKSAALVISGSVGGGSADTQYTDGQTPPTNPIGNALVFDNAGTWVDVGNDHPFPVNATNPSVGTDGSAIPGSSTLIGGSDGVNLQPLQVDASKNLKVVQQGNIDISNFPSSQRTNAQSGDVVDGAVVTLGSEGDSAATSDTGSFTLLALFKRSLQKLTSLVTAVQGVLSVQQTDLSVGPSVISAAQPSINTPVSNATVSLTLGQGQSSWMAQVSANAGFTSASTIVVDQSIDGGTTFFVTNFKVSGSLQNTPVQSVVGPGPLLISGDAASKGIIRIRCSVLNASESMNVTIKSGAGIGNIGLLSSVPSGNNLIGAIMRSVVSLFSTAQSTVGSGNSGDITVGPYTEISIDITTTAQAGTNPTIQFFWERKGVDGIYYPIWQTNPLTAAANTISTSIGTGMAYNQSLGSTGRLRWLVGGSATPTWTFTPNVYGK